MAALRAQVSAFVGGVKTLYSDLKAASALRQASKKEGRLLSWSEERLIRRSRADCLTAAPLVLCFAVPLLGNVAPILGMRYPRYLLPMQFWGSGQEKLALLRQDALEMRESMLPRTVSLLKDRVPEAEGGLLPRQALALIPQFGGAASASLSSLPRMHVQHLVRSCMSLSWYTRGLLVHVAPTPALRVLLDRRTRSLLSEDAALRRVTNMSCCVSPEDLMMACWERGLPAENVREARKSLRCWIRLTRALSGREDVPSSWVLHAPAMLFARRSPLSPSVPPPS
jgi:hypothetical protein